MPLLVEISVRFSEAIFLFKNNFEKIVVSGVAAFSLFRVLLIGVHDVPPFHFAAQFNRRFFNFFFLVQLSPPHSLRCSFGAFDCCYFKRLRVNHFDLRNGPCSALSAAIRHRELVMRVCKCVFSF